MSFTIDFKDFEKGFIKLVERTIPPEAGKGLFKAGNELLSDAIKVAPIAPFDDGSLKGSARTAKVDIKRGEISTVTGFNIEYAARWHELSPAEDSKINWTTPGSGRKYLESKMTRFKDKYMKIVAKHIENVLRRK